MWFNENPNSNCTRARFSEMFVHELGRAMGFFHVPTGFGYVMAKGEYAGRGDFTVKERQHARHAYKRGRRAPFCSDAMTCASKAFGFSHGRISVGIRRYCREPLGLCGWASILLASLSGIENRCGRAGQLHDVQAGVDAVRQVDQPTVVDLHVVRLDGHLAGLDAVDGGAALGRSVVAGM